MSSTASRQRSSSSNHSSRHGGSNKRSPPPSSSNRSNKRHHTSSRGPQTIKPQDAVFIPDDSKKNVKKVKSEFMCDVKLRNHLPPPPFEPKLLHLALAEDRLIMYCGSSLEQKLKRPMLTERFLGLPIDIIDKDKYKCSEEIKKKGMDPRDKMMFLDSGDKGSSKLNRGNRITEVRGKAYSWLTKTTYLENNPYASKAHISQSMLDRNEATKIKQNKTIDSRELQMKLIDETFTHSSKTPQHPTKKRLKPTKIVDILPHPSLFEKKTPSILWLEFDQPLCDAVKSNLAVQGKDLSDETTTQLARESILQKHGEDMYSFYAPSEEKDTLDDGTEEKFEWVREFKKYPTPTVDKDNNFLFFFEDEKVYYHTYSARANLRKRTQTANDYTAESEIRARSKEYTVIYREPSEEDLNPTHSTINSVDLESDLFGFDEDEEEEEVERSGGKEEAVDSID